MALCLGALVGLERQVAQEESGGEKDFPGVRTFAFLALVGALAVLVREPLGPWMGVALFLATAMFLVLRYSHDATTRGDPGYTTEIASLCTFVFGALAQSGQLLVASVLTIAMVALLRSKRALHRAGDLLEPLDMEALIRFLVITGIVLPLLPSEPLDRVFEIPLLAVLQPRDIWRMVVLISGVSFLGYVLIRVGGGRSSPLAVGLLSGLVSSTAAALTWARAARETREIRGAECLVLLAASMTFVRLGAMILVIAPPVLVRVALPLLAMFGAGLLLVALRHRPHEGVAAAPALRNPLRLKLAFGFAGVYAAILLLIAAVQSQVGERAVYLLSGVAALSGADAPSLSLARLGMQGGIDLRTAATGIVIVAVTTTLGKLAIVGLAGPAPLARRIAPSLIAVAAVGVASLLLL